MKKYLFLILIGFLPFALTSQSTFENTLKYKEGLGDVKGEIENVSWLAGHWKGEAFGGIVEELWSEPIGNSMMASFRLVVDNKVQFYEIETISEENETLVLRLKHFNDDLKGWEEKDEVIEFKLVKIDEAKVFFDQFTIEKIGDNEINMYVVVGDGEKESEIKFNYHRVKLD